MAADFGGSKRSPKYWAIAFPISDRGLRSGVNTGFDDVGLSDFGRFEGMADAGLDSSFELGVPDFAFVFSCGINSIISLVVLISSL
jgi:hypothetical protein